MPEPRSPENHLQFPDLRIDCLRGIQILLEAHDVAKVEGLPVTDMAVECYNLNLRGLTDHDLRVLRLARLVRMGIELTSPGALHRDFRWFDNLVHGFQAKCCSFVLTEEGEKWSRAWISRCGPERNGATLNSTSVSIIPQLKPESGELWLLGQPILQFKHPISNVKRLVEEFHRHYWARSIDNPYLKDSYLKGMDTLRAAVEKLNRALKGQLLHFRIFNSGKTVGWEIQLPSRGKSAAIGL